MSIIESMAAPTRFDVDPKVKDLEKGLRVRERNVGLLIGGTAWALFFLGSVVSVVFCSIELSHGFSMTGLGRLLGAIFGVLLALGFAPMLYYPSVKPEMSAGNRERRNQQRSLKKSVKAARTLSETVPVLTKEHVEAGIRLDKAVADAAHVWEQRDVETVRALLLADTNREDTILTLIEERGLTTADQVTEALNEMETNTKPLQDGWL